jgi:hypothetical protein
MKTRLIFAFAAFILAGWLNINAQAPQQGRPDTQQILQMAVDRMAKELALDDQTTVVFTEIYKAYLTEKFAIMSELRGLRGSAPRQPEADRGERKGRKGHQEESANVQNEESAAEQIVKGFERRQKMIEIEQKQLALDIVYCDKFNKVLNPKQILKIYERMNRFGQPFGGQNGGGPQFHGGRPGGQGGFPGGRQGGFGDDDQGGWSGGSGDWE